MSSFDPKAVLCRATGIACDTPESTERAVRAAKRIPKYEVPRGVSFPDLQNAIDIASRGFTAVVKEAADVARASTAVAEAAVDLAEAAAKAGIAEAEAVASGVNAALENAKQQLAGIVQSLTEATTTERSSLEARAVELLREMKDLDPSVFVDVVAALPPDVSKAIKRRVSAKKSGDAA